MFQVSEFTRRLLTSPANVFETNFKALNKFGWPLEAFTAALRVGFGCCAPDPAIRMKLPEAREELVPVSIILPVRTAA